MDLKEVWKGIKWERHSKGWENTWVVGEGEYWEPREMRDEAGMTIKYVQFG